MSEWVGGIAAGRPGGTLVVCPNGHTQWERVVFEDAAERLWFAGVILDNTTAPFEVICPDCKRPGTVDPVALRNAVRTKARSWPLL